MSALSGQKKVTTHGTSVPLGNQDIFGPIEIKALTTNTGLVYIGNDGSNDVDNNTGLELKAGELVVMSYIGNLKSIYVDSENNNEGVSWLVLAQM